MSKIFKKILIYIPCILLVIYFLISMKLLFIEPYDELWNFQNVLKMYNGSKIYSEINVIITPLFYYLGLGFLKILGPTLMSFRIYGIVLNLIYFSLIYLIYKQLNVSRHINFVFVTLIFFITVHVLNAGANYNTLAMIFMFLGIMIYLKNNIKNYLKDENIDSNKNENKNKNANVKKNYFDYIQGAVAFLVFISKQNLGIYYLCAIIVFEFLSRRSVKEWFTKQLKKMLVLGVLLILFVIVLSVNGNLSDFINYAFGGILEFGKGNFAIAFPIDLSFYCIAAIASVILVYKFGKKHCSEEFLINIKFLSCIAIFSTLLCFPIANAAHMLYILSFYFFIWFYFLDYAMLESCFAEIKYEKGCILLCSIMIIFWICRLGIAYVDMYNEIVLIEDKNSKYNQLYICDDGIERINELKEYIINKKNENKEVIILSYEAVLPMIELDINNGDFDLAFVGNLGNDGENRLIDKIKELENTEILIFTDEEDCFWQESKKVREYIMNNMRKTGELLEYTVYEK